MATCNRAWDDVFVKTPSETPRQGSLGCPVSIRTRESRNRNYLSEWERKKKKSNKYLLSYLWLLFLSHTFKMECNSEIKWLSVIDQQSKVVGFCCQKRIKMKNPDNRCYTKDCKNLNTISFGWILQVSSVFQYFYIISMTCKHTGSHSSNAACRQYF